MSTAEKGGGGAYFQKDMILLIIIVQLEYWWQLNLVVGSKSTLQIKVLADLNLAVWYVIAIYIHVRKKFGRFEVVKANCQIFLHLQKVGIS